MKTIYVVMHSCPIQKRDAGPYCRIGYAVDPYPERVFESEDDAIKYIEDMGVTKLYFGVWYSELKHLPGTVDEQYYSKYTIHELILH